MAGFRHQALFLLAVFAAFLQTNCSRKDQSLVSLSGKWKVERVEASAYDDALSIILKPFAGEVVLGSDNRFLGYLLFPPFGHGVGHGPDREEFSGTAKIDSKAGTIEVTPDGIGSEVTLYKYRLSIGHKENALLLRSGKEDLLELDKNTEPEQDDSLWQVKIYLTRKAAH